MKLVTFWKSQIPQCILAATLALATTHTNASSVVVTTNTINTIVDDMRLKNDVVLAGYENRNTGWYVGPGHVVMSTTPVTTYTPAWYKPIWSGEPQQTLEKILGWMVIFPGVSNQTTQVNVNVRNLKVWQLSKRTNRWQLLDNAVTPTGWYYETNLVNIAAPEQRTVLLDGTAMIVPSSAAGTYWHGWSNMQSLDASDVAAWFITVQAKLIGPEPELSKAEYLIHVGADYYLASGKSPFPTYNPGVGVSRSKLLTSTWQSFNFVTLSNVGVQDPGGGITEQEFRENPPPLD